jgi:repressor LexA
MNGALHSKQKAILEILKRGEENLSLRDIAEEIGVNSPNTVLHHIKQLEKKGYLRRDPVNPANYIILKDPIKDITYINLYETPAQCGSNGLLAEENVIDRIPLSTKTFGVSDRVFLVKARGDSMEPFIFENDLVLVLKQPDVESGEVGVVIHNNEPKIKKIIKVGRKYVLESLNPKYSPEVINTEDDFYIVGKVKSVIHFTGRLNKGKG